MPLTLYSAPVSPYGNVAEVALRLLEEPYKLVILSPHSRNPAFQKASPLGRLPAAEIDGFCMSDSDAIANYFDFKHGNKLYGNDSETRSKVMFIVKYAQTEGSQCSARIMRHFLSGNNTPEVIAKEVKAAQPVLQNMSLWVQGNGHFVGTSYTMADVAVFCHLLSFITTGNSLDNHPELAKFYAKCLEHPVFKATHERSVKSFNKHFAKKSNL